MSDIEGVYEDLEADVSLEEFREAVEAKVEQMGGLADEETAAMLVAHEIGESEVGGIADIEPGMEEAKFVAKVLSIGDVRTFERDGEDEDGRVVNVEVADETGSVRAAFWDEHAEAATEELEEGQVLRIKGRPKEGFSGVEVSVDDVEPDPDTEIDVQVSDTHTVEALSLGLSNVNLVGLVLDTDSVRTFDRDDGSEGKVSNLVLGDETGRIRVTLWDEQADLATEFDPGETVEVIDGYVKERDGNLELHVGNRGAVEEVDEEVEYVPESTPIEDLEIGQTVDIAGVVRSADPKRTFDRDDGSEGQVRNIRVQDATGDIRVAMWGEKADLDVGPGDEVALGDVEIQDGWQDDLEASAGWQSTITVLESDSGSSGGESAADDASNENAGLSAFGGDADGPAEEESETSAASSDDARGTTGANADAETDEPTDGEELEFTGVVVQAGDPVVLDDGESTMSVATDADVGLGEEVTARGIVRDGRLEANDVF
ncbi:nucleic acid binding OB-fold tRNA/helicase-type [Haloterrigena turkmenica DSM 5511]|uniref:Nucleic acid binding OB-fold tRNA/helicase-type n=1 Tax=Haloterrigena turkmenica (strain ATCC 51198 / DSM 5511 / JCM 9101 / NCIMB 13204 / VKM B-1734 / 4k) TaxID=543526 RepID=D2RV22_HALTV|nr:single-stranded DNA binding protein [Haloterrigena turkmenica]ADB59315.1 nucleic acid binding OB-fold tRNA/helicase-type [Haloterrigena turkmenica DSM 5511]